MCGDAEGRGCWYEWCWVVSRDGSSMSVQCVLRVFKWVKSQLWLPDGGRLDPDHFDRPGLWCAPAYYWHYRETGIFLPNHFQLLHTSPRVWPAPARPHQHYTAWSLCLLEHGEVAVCCFLCNQTYIKVTHKFSFTWKTFDYKIFIADKPGRMNTIFPPHHRLFLKSSAHKQYESNSIL